MLDLVLKGRLVLPGRSVTEGWLGIAGGRIVSLGEGEAPEASKTIDHGESFILPGAIDGQTHAGSQWGFAGIAPTTKAAAIGGVTTIVDMPYDHPDPIMTVDLLEQKVAAIEELAHTNVALYATIPTEPDPADIRGLVEAGVAAFKISSFEAHPHRFPRIGSDAVLTLFESLDGTGLPVGLHNEDQEVIRATEAKFRAEGRTTPLDHSPSRPPVAEMSATATFLELGASLGGHAHIVHISIPEGFELVAEHAARGEKASAEMCLHYLLFDADEHMPKLGPKLKVNPPIRSGVRDALWQVIEDGGAAFVSSDHSAWGLERKASDNIFEVAAGMPGLETLLPGFYTEALRRTGSVEMAACLTAALLAEGPADFFGLATKGRLEPGCDADIAVLAPGEVVYNSALIPEGSSWSAYDGMTFAATTVATYVNGVLAWNGKAVTEETPGTYARRSA
ncbi:dihydroorotase [Tropicimonas marinistellae]|uniref:dihydroorotase n=1 Tax=Tropicimonas marinistellae TaxID=1739787 RepID=UPI0008351F55|nr:amidohydrolase family protein [Tropicimonas marinistellae]